MAEGGYLRELLTLLGFDLNETGFKRAESGFKSLIGLSAELVARVANVGVRIGALALDAAHAGTDLDLMAKSVGLSVERFQTLGFAGSKAGLELEQLRELILNLQEKSAEARGDSKDLAQAFVDLGVSTGDLKRFANDGPGLLLKVGDALARMTDASKKAQVGIKLFSEEGFARALPFLELGAAKIKEYEDEAQRLGIVTKAQIADMRKATQSQGALNYVFELAKLKLGAGLAPIIIKVGDAFLKLYESNRTLIDDGITKLAEGTGFLIDMLANLFGVIVATANSPGLGLIVSGLRGVLRAVRAVVDFLAKHERFVMTLAPMLATLILYKLMPTIVLLAKTVGVAGLKMARAWLIANAPLLAAIAAVVLLALLVEDLYGFMTGKKSLIGEFFKVFLDAPASPNDHWVIKTIRFILHWIREGIRFLDDFFDQFFKTVFTLVDMQDAFTGVWTSIVDEGKRLITEFLMWFSNGVKGISDQIAGALTGGIGERIANWVHGPTATRVATPPVRMTPKTAPAWTGGMPSPAASSPYSMGPIYTGKREVNVTVKAQTGASPKDIATETAKAVTEADERDRRATAAALKNNRVR
jgi:hypothetical protein